MKRLSQHITILALILLVPAALWGTALSIPNRSTKLKDLPKVVCDDKFLKGQNGIYICADPITGSEIPTPVAGCFLHSNAVTEVLEWADANGDACPHNFIDENNNDWITEAGDEWVY